MIIYGNTGQSVVIYLQMEIQFLVNTVISAIFALCLLVHLHFLANDGMFEPVSL
jgi:hypothetical protein